MKDFSLIINPFAEEDLKDAKKWYDLQLEKLGDDFLKEIRKTIFHIQKNPLQFQKVRKQTRRAIVKRFPYLIYFVVNDQVINVFAVFHSSRSPEVWKERDKE